jgi:hypothetical protein
MMTTRRKNLFPEDPVIILDYQGNASGHGVVLKVNIGRYLVLPEHETEPRNYTRKDLRYYSRHNAKEEKIVQ